jgi:hypothetical protein
MNKENLLKMENQIDQVITDKVNSEIIDESEISQELENLNEVEIIHDTFYSDPEVHPEARDYEEFRRSMTTVTKIAISKGGFLFYLVFYIIFTIVIGSLYIANKTPLNPTD